MKLISNDLYLAKSLIINIHLSAGVFADYMPITFGIKKRTINPLEKVLYLIFFKKNIK
jgi:hypothetical protein